MHNNQKLNKMKKIALFGSTGTIGRKALSQSLENGYEVLAFCRNKADLAEFNHPNLKIYEGNVLSVEDVNQAMKGQDAVIVCLGSGKSRKGTVRSEGTKNIIAAMKNNGVNRLICQSTLGTHDSRGNLNFFWKYIMFGWFLKEVYQDHELQEEYVQESGLDWTIVRPSAFTDGGITGQYKHGFGANEQGLSLKISRADVAHFLLRQLGSTDYLHKTPGVSN